MGMYDEINYEMPCPRCGSKLDSFQSKDGHCLLARLEFWEVNNFYDLCNKCGAWIEFNLKHKKKYKITDYEMIVREK